MNYQTHTQQIEETVTTIRRALNVTGEAREIRNKHLKKHEKITIRELIEASGLSRGKICLILGVCEKNIFRKLKN